MFDVALVNEYLKLGGKMQLGGAVVQKEVLLWFSPFFFFCVQTKIEILKQTNQKIKMMGNSRNNKNHIGTLKQILLPNLSKDFHVQTTSCIYDTYHKLCVSIYVIDIE